MPRREAKVKRCLGVVAKPPELEALSFLDRTERDRFLVELRVNGREMVYIWVSVTQATPRTHMLKQSLAEFNQRHTLFNNDFSPSQDLVNVIRCTTTTGEE